MIAARRARIALACGVLACGSPEPTHAPPSAPTPTPRVVEPAPPPPGPSPPVAPIDPSVLLVPRANDAPTLDGRLDELCWSQTPSIAIDRDFRNAPFDALETTARMVWTPSALFLAFEGSFDGSVDAPDGPTDLDSDHLYGHDALEAFFDFDPSTPETYREIELGPRGHFLDVDVDRARRPRGDVTWSSGVTVATVVDDSAHRFAIEARIPSTALVDGSLSAGDARIGLVRIGRAAGTRVFLARFPAETERPNFHVPERFGTLRLAP